MLLNRTKIAGWRIAPIFASRAMSIAELFADRSLKPKEKVELLARLLAEMTINIPELIAFTEGQRPPVKASCIEALERLTSTRPEALPEAGLDLCLRSLGDKEPRVKWESARVIANSIQHFPKRAEEAVKALLGNVHHEGTVVRWSAASALAQVIVMKTPANKMLLPEVAAIIKREEKNSIRKIYEAAVRKVAN